MKKIKAIPTEIYSRVVGYYRPLSSWNDGKRAEFSTRHMPRYYGVCDVQGVASGDDIDHLDDKIEVSY